MKTWHVGYHHNDPYTTYLEMGSPTQLTRTQEKSLRDASRGEPDSVAALTVGPGGKLAETLPLHENDVILLKLAPVTD